MPGHESIKKPGGENDETKQESQTLAERRELVKKATEAKKVKSKKREERKTEAKNKTPKISKQTKREQNTFIDNDTEAEIEAMRKKTLGIKSEKVVNKASSSTQETSSTETAEKVTTTVDTTPAATTESTIAEITKSTEEIATPAMMTKEETEAAMEEITDAVKVFTKEPNAIVDTTPTKSFDEQETSSHTEPTIAEAVGDVNKTPSFKKADTIKDPLAATGDNSEIRNLVSDLEKQGITVNDEAIEKATANLNNVGENGEKKHLLVEDKPKEKKESPIESMSIDRKAGRAEFIFKDENTGEKRRVAFEDITGVVNKHTEGKTSKKMGAKQAISVEQEINRAISSELIETAKKEFETGGGETIAKEDKKEKATTIFSKIKEVIQKATETEETISKKSEKEGSDPGRIEQLHAKKKEIQTMTEMGEITEEEAGDLHNQADKAIEKFTEAKYGEEVKGGKTAAVNENTEFVNENQEPIEQLYSQRAAIGTKAELNEITEEEAVRKITQIDQQIDNLTKEKYGEEPEVKTSNIEAAKKIAEQWNGQSQEKSPKTQEELTNELYEKFNEATNATVKHNKAYKEALEHQGPPEDRPYSKAELDDMKADAELRQNAYYRVRDELDTPPPKNDLVHYFNTGEKIQEKTAERTAAGMAAEEEQGEVGTETKRKLPDDFILPGINSSQTPDTATKETPTDKEDIKAIKKTPSEQEVEETKKTPLPDSALIPLIDTSETPDAAEGNLRIAHEELSKLENLYKEEKAVGVHQGELADREEEIQTAKEKIEEIKQGIETERARPLEEARAAFAEASKKHAEANKAHNKKFVEKSIIGKLAGAFVKESEEEKTASLQRTQEAYQVQDQAKQTYEQSKLAYGQNLFDAKKAEFEKQGLSGNNLEEELRKYKATEIFDKLIINERDLLQAARNEAWSPKEKNTFMRALDWYNKQNRLTKITISTAIITGAITGVPAIAAAAGTAAGGGGLAMGAAVATASKAFGTSLASAFFGVGVGGTVDIGTGWSKGIKETKERGTQKARTIFSNEELSSESIVKGEERHQQVLEKERKAERTKTLVKAAISVGTGFGTSYIATNYGENIKEATNEFLAKSPRANEFITRLKDATTEAKEFVGEAIGQAKEAIPSGLSGKETIEAAIRGTGPEGAVIEKFTDPNQGQELAKSFGWDGKSDLTKWAEIKAHNLWREDMSEALAKTDTLEKMQKLGYSPNEEGYTQMMSRIGKGTVELDPTSGKIELVNTEYLKAQAVDTEYLRQTAETAAGKGEVPITEATPALKPLPSIEETVVAQSNVETAGSKTIAQASFEETQGITHTDTLSPQPDPLAGKSAMATEHGPEGIIQQHLEKTGIAPENITVPEYVLRPEVEKEMFNIVHQGGFESGAETRYSKIINLLGEGKINPEDIEIYYNQKTGMSVHHGYLKGQMDIVRKIAPEQLKKMAEAIVSKNSAVIKSFDIRQIAAIRRLRFVLDALYKK